MEVYKHDGTWLADTDTYGDNMSKQKKQNRGEQLPLTKSLNTGKINDHIC